MKGYLQQRTPLFSHGEKDLLGYKMNYGLYLVAVIAIPTILLIIVFLDCYDLRRIRSLIEGTGELSASTDLTVNSLAFPRITATRDEAWKLYVASFCLTLFLLATLAQTIALAGFSWYGVTGILYIDPLLNPDIKITYTPGFKTMIGVRASIVTCMINLWLCFKIWRVTMIKDKWERIGLAWP